MALLRVPTTLTFNGKELDPDVFKVEHLPDYTIAQKDIQAIHVNGRNGDILIDSGSYRDIPRTYNISFGSSGPAEFAERVSAISKWLICDGYGELHDTYENEYYRLAYPSGAFPVKSKLNGRIGETKIEFACSPKRFLLYGKNGFQWKRPLNEFATPYEKGDVNGNKKIDLGGRNNDPPGDAFLALNLAVDPDYGDLPAAAKRAADYDGDRSITSADARLITRAANVIFYGYSLDNPTDFGAKPIIECKISSIAEPSFIYFEKSLYRNDPQYTIELDFDDLLDQPQSHEYVTVVVDCERETVYEKGTYKNLNLGVKTPDGFPIMPARENTVIRFDGFITEVRVYPRFWTL